MGVIQGSQDNSHDQPLQRCEGLQHHTLNQITLLMPMCAVILKDMLMVTRQLQTFDEQPGTSVEY